MATMAIRIPDSKHERLRRFAESQGISLNKLVEEWAARTPLAQFDAEVRFKSRAARGNVTRGLALLDQVDRAFAAQVNHRKDRKRQS